MSPKRGRLSNLDERLVPALGRGLRRAVDVFARRPPGAASDDEPPPTPPAAPRAARPRRQRHAVAAPIRARMHGGSDRMRGSADRVRRRLWDLDVRYARREPIASVRRAPQLAGGVVAVLLLAGIIGAVRLPADDVGSVGAPTTNLAPPSGTVLAPPSTVPDSCPIGNEPSGAAMVGPPVGADVNGYVNARTQALRACAAGAADDPLLAIVSLPAPLTPAAAAQLFGSVVVIAAYADPAAGGNGLLMPLAAPLPAGGDLTTALRAAYSRTASQLLADADARRGTAAAATLPAAERARTLGIANADTAQQKALEAGCACIYGAAVQGSVRTLVALSRAAGIRLVDAAPSGTDILGLAGRPLLPRETATVLNVPAPEQAQVGAP